MTSRKTHRAGSCVGAEEREVSLMAAFCLEAFPSERVKGLPESISAIVMKLLAKTPEDRYQTAAGVEADLRSCLAALESVGRIARLPLGMHDMSDRLLIPEKLYGREREIRALLAAFDRVAAGGTPEFVLMSGYSGVGESSVLNELCTHLIPRHGLFASCKFDQRRRDIPYATLAQAFRTLIDQILVDSDAEVSHWRNALREAVGPNGRGEPLRKGYSISPGTRLRPERSHRA